MVFGLRHCYGGCGCRAKLIYANFSANFSANWLQILRDQMSAAVRLGVIGPLEAARRQQGLYEYCARILAEGDGIEYTGATRTAPQLDIAQSLHDHLYSRLFQS